MVDPIDGLSFVAEVLLENRDSFRAEPPLARDVA